MQSTALELAEELFDHRHALVLGDPPSPERDRLEMESLFDLARLWTWREGYHSPRLAQAAERLGELAGTAEPPPPARAEPITADDPVLSALQVRFSYDMVSGNGGAAARVAARLQELAAAHPDPMIALAASVATCVSGVHAPRVGEALAAVDQGRRALEALDPARSGAVLLPLGQQAAWPTHCSFAAWAHWLAGDRTAAAAELAAARGFCDRRDHPFTRIFCVTVEGIVGVMERSPEAVLEAIAWGDAGADDAWQFGLMHAWREMQAAWAHGMRDGDPAAAAALLRSTLAALEQQGARVVQSLYWGMVAELEMRAERPDAALDAARSGIGHGAAGGERFWYPVLEGLAGEALRALGRPAESRAALQRGLAAAGELALPLVAARIGAAAPT